MPISTASIKAQTAGIRPVNPIDSVVLILAKNCAMVLSVDAEPSPVPQGTLFLTGSTV
jgi:hypothetical protein